MPDGLSAGPWAARIVEGGYSAACARYRTGS